MKIPTFGEVEFEFTAEPEDTDPADSFENPGDAAFARQDDPAHWFCAVVTARWNGHETSDYLGGCSYISFEEFTSEKGSYFEGMKREAYSRLVEELKAAALAGAAVDLALALKAALPIIAEAVGVRSSKYTGAKAALKKAGVI